MLKLMVVNLKLHKPHNDRQTMAHLILVCSFQNPGATYLHRCWADWWDSKKELWLYVS